MSKQKRILISLPETLSAETDNLATCLNVSRSELIREALRNYIKDFRKREIGEMMKKGYAEMGEINLEIAEGCLSADNSQLSNYEEKLSECEE